MYARKLVVSRFTLGSADYLAWHKDTRAKAAKLCEATYASFTTLYKLSKLHFKFSLAVKRWPIRRRRPYHHGQMLHSRHRHLNPSHGTSKPPQLCSA